MQLRDYQLKAVNDTYAAIREGHKRIVIASCTGSGKTVVMGKIASDIFSKGKKCLVIVDDSPLIEQTIDKFAKYGLKVGVIKSGYMEKRQLNIQVASVDTLIRREFPSADVVFIDECHLSYAKKYERIFEHYRDKIFIGFSATPERMNKRESLTKDWEYMVRGLTLMESIAGGYNVPLIVYPLPHKSLGLGHIKIKKGDYDESQLALTMTQEKVIDRAIDDWEKYAFNRPTICFAVNRDHSKIFCDRLRNRGISAEWIDGTTTDEDRKAKYSRLRSGETKILCSVNVLSVGFDEPCISAIISCRPSKSNVIWIQQCGRGSRLFEGKEDCIIIDHSENTWNLGHPMEYVPPDLQSLPDKEKQEAPVKICPECDCAVLSFMMECPQCGYQFPAKNDRKEYEGDLKEVSPVINNDKLREQRCYYQELLLEAFNNQWSPDYASVRYKEKFGFFPNTLIKRHALFGKYHSEDNVESYLDYLVNVANRKDKNESWVLRHISSEFGKITI
jgi:superfamily II DNA or RNA helicase